MRLKIVSERRGANGVLAYKVANAETDEMLEGVTCVSFNLDINGAHAQIELAGPELDVEIEDVKVEAKV